MSLAINDIDTLKSSFVNLLVMVFLSVATAYLYFLLSPLTELTPELEARTQPNILDVLVAIFGGLALIVARTKKGTIASVIFWCGNCNSINASFVYGGLWISSRKY